MLFSTTDAINNADFFFVTFFAQDLFVIVFFNCITKKPDKIKEESGKILVLC